MDLLHVVLELLDGAFVQIATEQCEQIGGQAQRLDEGRAGQLPRHVENRVRPSTEERKGQIMKWLNKIEETLSTVWAPGANVARVMHLKLKLYKCGHSNSLSHTHTHARALPGLEIADARLHGNVGGQESLTL